MPPVLRKLLKTTKQEEVFQVTTSRRDKYLPYFTDPQGVFSLDLLTPAKSQVTFTVNLIAFEQKDYLFKILFSEKLARLSFIKQMATDFFKAGNLRKAIKVYGKVHSYFRTKDAKNNFQKEDEQTEEYL